MVEGSLKNYCKSVRKNGTYINIRSLSMPSRVYMYVDEFKYG